MRPRLLDLFCGAGGAAMGYHRAGFEVVGVDIKPQKRFPFEFHQADAMTYPLEGFDVIHASPPCQLFSIASALHRNNGKVYPDCLTPTRERLKSWGGTWVMENVPQSPLDPTIILCGIMFGLHVFRHRHFEMSHLMFQPPHPSHKGKKIGQGYYSVAGGTGRWKSWGAIEPGIMKGTIKECSAAMGIDWMTRKELCQAIPPAYTEWIGKQLQEAL
jgi:hypothetical protein